MTEEKMEVSTDDYVDSESKEELVHEEIEENNNIVKGSLWMTIGSITSRLLGAVYIIPWYAWMGEHAEMANSLFGKGYNIYSFFLMIATAGIPSAVGKQIAKYNALNEYRLSDRLFRKSLGLMSIFGFIFAAVMFFAAPVLAQGDMNLVPTMRALSLSVLIFPCMSVVRGYFMGNQDLMPSAVSQIVEQFIRVFYMLLMTFIIMKVLSGDYVAAVTQSTFAAFVGMIGSFAVLGYFYWKGRKERSIRMANSNNELSVSTTSLIKEMLIEAIPFIIIGSAIPLFKLVDQYTFEPMMKQFTSYSSTQLKEMFSILSVNPDKLTMIIISLATSLSAASLPVITEAFIKGDRKGVGKLCSESIQLFCLVMFPAIVGMSIVAVPVYTIFYGHNMLGSEVLIACTVSSLVSGFFMLSSVLLQAMFMNRQLLIELAIGFIVKCIIQYPCIYAFKIYGPIIATTIAFCITDLLIIRSLTKASDIRLSLLGKRLLLILLMTTLMGVGTFLAEHLLCQWLSPASRLGAMVLFAICLGVGVVIYAYFVLKTRIGDVLLGQKIGGLRQKLRIK
ncbi:putative polysaccharide biosynthesis protein [Catellicoccus marimammalium]|uniref:Membrane protein involved in the export of O-antigen, teichoic acid, and lipoteichoic acid n=1 Tax=Catellicoccus marimammalium M35/04/3 TaxID=1234409 RepID=K8ZMS6_9ENTE|nr:polysaccharide biosynthesis protein [Catellicoccus marimammalium]EKU27853.1 Membrane protein involved in the export of O-antigen, teichoic acid, and lipoteichoic acid [Catellicoccus marimammalium M35/04/3]